MQREGSWWSGPVLLVCGTNSCPAIGFLLTYTLISNSGSLPDYLLVTCLLPPVYSLKVLSPYLSPATIPRIHPFITCSSPSYHPLTTPSLPAYYSATWYVFPKPPNATQRLKHPDKISDVIQTLSPCTPALHPPGSPCVAPSFRKLTRPDFGPFFVCCFFPFCKHEKDGCLIGKAEDG